MVSAVTAGFLRVLTIGVLAAAIAPQASLAATPAQSAAVTAANDWIRLIDRQRWGESWAKAGTLFRGQITQDRWATMIKGARAPIGNVVARSFESATAASSLPGAPDGKYQIVHYTTRFTGKQAAMETIILDEEKSGWKVAGYFLR